MKIADIHDSEADYSPLERKFRVWREAFGIYGSVKAPLEKVAATSEFPGI
jgi:hypothetical protein